MNDKRFEIGDTVVYAMEGVCTVQQIQLRDFNGSKMEYYVLCPVLHRDSVVYVPAQNEQLQKKMRCVLSVQELEHLIETMPEKQTIWIDNENERKQCYRRILAQGDRDEVVSLIKTLYLQRQKLEQKGRKLHLSDERFFKEAERLLYDEFAHVLGIPKSQVLPMIMKKLEKET